MQFGKQIRKGTLERLKVALKLNPGLATSFQTIQDAPGHTEEEFMDYGVTPSDLKRLERTGLALRGYTQERTGYRVKWLVIKDLICQEK